MNAVETPRRHEIVFSMTDSSKERVGALLRRCGHENLNLLLARGLALVEWVEDQAEQGRTVGSVIYGDAGAEVRELQERPELLKPRSPAPAQVNAAPVAEQPKAPAPKAARKPAVRSRGDKQSRAAMVRAHQPNDDGPIKSFTWVRWNCEQNNRAAPICYRDMPLPGELDMGQLEELEGVLTQWSWITHFRLHETGFMSYYAFDLKRGWRNIEPGTLQNFEDSFVDGGIEAIFPIQLAVDYLREHSQQKTEVV